ncbi:urease subunit beta [Hoyosella sp. YIM 151337]|uniref:urease subunit beta n=1 Tax=Hoyosella sp. YIM 151337 TaxID=2992742 RepID=UPI002236BD85|nr:urease subunit beta [Hoyosella sp. YIM 151337]MCW4352996.1 urease subunit beta [Hoyosella sp. YIM 151337]
MIPGEIVTAAGELRINDNAQRREVDVVNSGDRPVQVGSHFHFAQANGALEFDRTAAHGHRLDIPAGTAIRFEPGIRHRVSLVPIGGTREVHGLSLTPPGKLDH